MTSKVSPSSPGIQGQIKGVLSWERTSERRGELPRNLAKSGTTPDSLLSERRLQASSTTHIPSHQCKGRRVSGPIKIGSPGAQSVLRLFLVSGE